MSTQEPSIHSASQSYEILAYDTDNGKIYRLDGNSRFNELKLSALLNPASRFCLGLVGIAAIIGGVVLDRFYKPLSTTRKTVKFIISYGVVVGGFLAVAVALLNIQVVKSAMQ